MKTLKNCCKKKLSKGKKTIFLWIIPFGKQIFDMETIMLDICEQRKSPFLKTGKVKSVLL